MGVVWLLHNSDRWDTFQDADTEVFVEGLVILRLIYLQTDLGGTEWIPHNWLESDKQAA